MRHQSVGWATLARSVLSGAHGGGGEDLVGGGDALEGSGRAALAVGVVLERAHAVGLPRTPFARGGGRAQGERGGAHHGQREVKGGEGCVGGDGGDGGDGGGGGVGGDGGDGRGGAPPPRPRIAAKVGRLLQLLLRRVDGHAQHHIVVALARELLALVECLRRRRRWRRLAR
eukprot:613856-Prymnesium_polylepis.1